MKHEVNQFDWLRAFFIIIKFFHKYKTKTFSEMRNTIFYLELIAIFIFIGFCTTNVTAQEDTEKSAFTASSVGISLGWYNPSLNYWKEDPFFGDFSYNGAISVRGFYDFQIINSLHGQIGLGYWQSTSEDYVQRYGDTKLLITGIPISLDVLYQIEPIKFSIITPYVGIGCDFTFIQDKFTYELLDNSDPKSGSTFLGNGIVGLEAKLSENFVMDFEFRYKFGSYKQEFKDDNNEILVGEVKLTGPFIGINLKYLF